MSLLIGLYLTYGVAFMEFFTNLLRKLRRSKTKPVKEEIKAKDVSSYGKPLGLSGAGAYQQALVNAMYGKDKRPVYTKRFEGDLLNGWEEDGEPGSYIGKRRPPDDIQ